MKKKFGIGLMMGFVGIASVRIPWSHNLIWSPGPEAYPTRVTVVGKWSYPIVRPPDVDPDDPRYVTLLPDEVTFFDTAFGDYRSYGLLAHNFLAGKDFELIEPGDYLKLDFPDGRERWFHIYKIIRAPKLPLKQGEWAPSIDLMGAELSQRQAYEFIYGHMGYLILQTCIGDQNGFIFVLGEPIQRPYYLLQETQQVQQLHWSAPRIEDLGIYNE
jgi:hypothetical protein